MFLHKYLNETLLNIVYETYMPEYLYTLDEENFQAVYNVFRKYHFYFIDDIIIKYIELFTIEPEYVEKALNKMKLALGDNFVYEIGNNIVLMEKVLELAVNYIK